MAVEVGHHQRHKRLHRHAVPVVLVMTGLLAISAAVTQQYAANPVREASAIRALTSRVIYLQPNAHGLTTFRISDQPTDPSVPVGVGDAGRSATLRLSLQ